MLELINADDMMTDWNQCVCRCHYECGSGFALRCLCLDLCCCGCFLHPTGRPLLCCLHRCHTTHPHILQLGESYPSLETTSINDNDNNNDTKT